MADTLPVIGALFAAYPMERYGRKWTFGAAVVLTFGFIFLQFFARSLSVLLAGELLGGLVLGTYAVIAPAYASEVCPVALRGVLTSYTNLCFVMGQLIANGVIAGTVSTPIVSSRFHTSVVPGSDSLRVHHQIARTLANPCFYHQSQLNNHWAYSAPFAAQWIWPVVILVGWPFAPESPYWLVRKGRLEDAEKSLRRLSSKGADVKGSLAIIVETDRLELELESGTTYWDCFKPQNIRRTEIAVGVYTIQVLSGIYLVGYTTYFFELAGLPTAKAFDMSVGFLAVGFVATCLSWILLTRFGRRTIYNYGLTCLVVLLFIIGILDCVPGYESKPNLAWAQASLMISKWTGFKQRA